jgi:hypothetical protein
VVTEQGGGAKGEVGGGGCFGAAAETGDSRGRRRQGGESPNLTEFWDPSSEWPEEDYFCNATLPTP